jgi:hypothetical protein
MKYMAMAGMLVVGIILGSVARPFERTMAQDSAPSSQIGVMSLNTSDQDIEMMRRDLRARKQQIIGENLRLNDAEAEKFWPLYHHYADDLKEIYNEKFRLLKQYDENWGSMSDQDALIYIRRWLEMDEKAQALRLEYVPKINQVLTGKKLATFFQLERRVNLMIEVQLASQIPLAQGKN